MAKYHEVTVGQVEAVVNAMGLDTFEKIAAGELAVRVGRGVAVVEPKVAPLFDDNGRCIPSRGLRAQVTDADPNFYFEQPMVKCGQRLNKILSGLQVRRFLSAHKFADRSERIIDRLRRDAQVSNILRGVHLPFCLPKQDVGDYGELLDKAFLPAVGRSYKDHFPERLFENRLKDKLNGRVMVVSGSRHEKLVDALNRGDVVGVYFPNCLQGYSVDACREQMASLPEQFLLAGGFDVCGAMIAYPDVLAFGRNGVRPWLAALFSEQCEHDCFCFGVRSDSMYFGSGPGVHTFYYGGLVVLG